MNEVVVEAEKGIKEILELIEGLELIGVNACKALHDGLNLSDLQYVVPVLKDMSKLVEAVKGIGELPAEVKDLNGDEAVEIVKKLFDAIKACKDACK